MLFAHRAACGRIGLVALAALLAAAALAAVLHSTPASAQPPDDLELILSLVGDSDNVVPPESTLTVAANLQHLGTGANLEITSGSLRVSGSLDWETLGRSSLPITPQKIGAAAWQGSGAALGDRFGAFGGTILDNDTFFVKSLQSNYDGATWSTGTGKVYVYDVPTKTEVGVITPPSGAATNSFSEGFDAYQEDANTGWIFVGSWRDSLTVPGATCREDNRGRASTRSDHDSTGTNCLEVGRVYIYRLDRSARPMTLSSTPCATLTPSVADAVYRESSSRAPLGGRFGYSVEINETTDTLVVGAPKMHYTGALKVFTKPSSAGGWCDLTYANVAATLTPTPIPTELAWSSATNKQKSYAARMWSSGPAGSAFGQEVKVSDDGNTLVVGAFLKYRNDNEVNFAAGLNEAGQVDIFVRPSGGWVDATAANARLWLTPTVTEARLGQWVAVSPDGASVAAVSSQRPQNPPNWPGYVYVWNRPSGGWTADDSNGADATISATGGRDGDQFGHSGVDFNHDGTRLAVSNHKYQDANRGSGDGRGLNSNASYSGRAWLFSGTNGSWATATTSSASATQIQSPAPRAGVFFGVVRYATDGRQLLVGQPEDSSLRNNAFGAGSVWLLNEQLEPQFFAGSACVIESGETLDDSTDDTNICPIDLAGNAQLVLAPGFDSGSFTISGRVTIDEQVIRGSLVVRVGEVKEVASATLEVGTDDRGSLGTADDRPHKTTLSPGETTVLRLRVLNENDAASGPNSISSILITAGGGLLSTNINDEELAPAAFSTARRNQDGCVGTGGLACQIRVASLNTANSDKIDITLRAPSPAKPGQVQVRAVVLSRTGESVEAEPLTIAFAGPPTDYAIAKPTTSVLNQDTPDEGAAADHRDRLLLSVTAADASGNQVELPGTAYQTFTRDRAIPEQHRLTILAPNGRRTTAGVSARWLPNAAGTGLQLDRAENPQIEIDVDAEETDKLANGEYTIELRVGAKTVTQKFVVSGGPATLALGEPQGSTAVNGQIRLTATVLDDEGNAVPNGTRVTWVDRPTGSLPVMIQLSADTRTEDGAASANFLVIGSGTGYVTATAGDATNIVLLQVGGPGERGEAAIAESLSSTQPGFSTWLGGEQRTRASQLLAAVDGVSSALLWENGIWLRYGVAASGLVIPGSMDFVIRHGAVLWLSE